MTLIADPVFIFGALRSGTTLFRVILNAHPNLNNPGEADFLFDYLSPDSTHPTGWRYDITGMEGSRIYQRYGFPDTESRDGLDRLDAMLRHLSEQKAGLLSLNIHRHADIAAQVLPHARFIHLLRDPRDVARSSIGMGWTGNSYHGVYHWIETEKGWNRAAKMLSPERLLNVTFEGLMSELESELHRVCDFLGAPFDPAMLEYHREGTYGPPDPSIAQQWRDKADPHQIALIEGRCGALLQQAGYDANGAPAYPGKLEELYLNTENRLRRWNYNIRRYGLPLFIANHITRAVGLSGVNTRLKKHMLRRDVEALK